MPRSLRDEQPAGGGVQVKEVVVKGIDYVPPRLHLVHRLDVLHSLRDKQTAGGGAQVQEFGVGAIGLKWLGFEQ